MYTYSMYKYTYTKFSNLTHDTADCHMLSRRLFWTIDMDKFCYFGFLFVCFLPIPSFLHQFEYLVYNIYIYVPVIPLILLIFILPKVSCMSMILL